MIKVTIRLYHCETGGVKFLIGDPEEIKTIFQWQG